MWRLGLMKHEDGCSKKVYDKVIHRMGVGEKPTWVFFLQQEIELLLTEKKPESNVLPEVHKKVSMFVLKIYKQSAALLHLCEKSPLGLLTLLTLSLLL